MIFLNWLFEAVSNNPIDSIEFAIEEVENNIVNADLDFEEQVPILIAIAIGKSAYNYWLGEVNNAASNWYTKNYFSPDVYVNYANIPYMVKTAMLGALSMDNKGKTYGLIDPPRVVGVDIVSAMTASIILSCGKVMFKWIVKMQPYIMHEMLLQKREFFSGNTQTENTIAEYRTKRFTCSIFKTCNLTICTKC
jgi:hypothetical protein